MALPLLPPSQAHKYMQELEEPLVSEYVEHSAGDRVQDWQAVNSVLDEGVDSFKQTLGNESSKTRSNMVETLHLRPPNREPRLPHPSVAPKE